MRLLLIFQESWKQVSCTDKTLPFHGKATVKAKQKSYGDFGFWSGWLTVILSLYAVLWTPIMLSAHQKQLLKKVQKIFLADRKMKAPEITATVMISINRIRTYNSIQTKTSISSWKLDRHTTYYRVKSIGR